MRSLRKLSFAVVLAAFWPGSTTAAIQDSNFTETSWASVPTTSWGVTGMAWAPDASNRLFLCRQDGNVYIVKNGVALSTPFATMSPIRTGGEEGLIGITFDPNFADNGYVYFFVTSANGNSEILRYNATSDVGTGRTALKSNLPNGGNHNGGGIGFGPDGKLYWSIGEGGQNVALTDLSTLNSKVGRMNPDGTAPSDNPYFTGNGNNNQSFIWARGFRNPYTLTFQPTTGKLWVNVVGTRAEQIFLVNAGDHAGYVQGDQDSEGNQVAPYKQPVLNYWEGDGDTYDIQTATRANGVVTVTLSENHFLYKPGQRVRIVSLPGFTTTAPHPPIIDIPAPNQFTFAQAGANTTVQGNGGYTNIRGIGNVVLGGTFYDGTQFPAAYRGNFFWGDFASGNVMRAVMGGTNESKFASIDIFSTGITQYIDAAVGPDGALYTVGYTGTIRRIAYKATQGIVLSRRNVRMSEGGHAVVMASLATAPAGGVTVNVARQSGDTDLSVSGGATLSFGPGNWNVPQPITIASAVDADSNEDEAAFVASATGLASQDFIVKATDSNDQAVIVSASTLAINEGANATFTVRLARQPAGNVTVAVSRSAGDATVTVSGGAALTFTTSNWSTPQTVTIAAANDADEDNETATVTVSPSAGIAPRNVAVTVRDSAPKVPVITSTAPRNAVVGAQYRYQVIATGNPDPTFSVPTAQPGMTINAASGMLTWTPGATGSFNATVRAQNSVGGVNQAFTVVVAADQPPKAILTAPKANETISGLNAEFYGDCEDDVGCTKADFFVDGVQKYTDTNAFNHFHMNSAHAQFDTFDYPNGPHKLKIKVTDTSGKSAEKEVDVVIANDGPRPDAGAGNGDPDAGTGPIDTSDAGASASAAPADDSGCSCHAGSSAAGTAGLFSGFAGLVAAIARRRRSKRA